MKYITILNIFAKLLFTVAIFVFVKEQADYWKVPLLNSLGFILAGVLALWIVFRDFEVRFRLFDLNTIKSYLYKGWNIFLSEISGNLYGQGTIFILGLVSSDKIVGYYSIGEKLVKVLASLSQPIAQSIYPYLSKKEKNEIIKIFKKFSKILFIYVFISLTVVSLSLNFIYFFLIKDYNIKLQLTFLFLNIGIFFTILNVLKQPIIYALQLDKFNTMMYTYTGISFIPICFALSYFFDMIGTSLSFLYVELVIFTWGLYIINLGEKYGKTTDKCFN